MADPRWSRGARERIGASAPRVPQMEREFPGNFQRNREFRGKCAALTLRFGPGSTHSPLLWALGPVQEKLRYKCCTRLR